MKAISSEFSKRIFSQSVRGRARVLTLPQSADTAQLAQGLARVEALLGQLASDPERAHRAGLCADARCTPCRNSRLVLARQVQEATKKSVLSEMDEAAESYGVEDARDTLAEAVLRLRAGPKDAQSDGVSEQSEEIIVVEE